MIHTVCSIYKYKNQEENQITKTISRFKVLLEILSRNLGVCQRFHIL